MPKSAPAVDDTPLFKILSWSMIDVSGDKRAESVMIIPGATAVQIENFLVGYALETNADIYAVRVTDVYESVALSSNAVQASQNSVTHQMIILYKNATRETEELFIVAPVRDLFVGDTDEPDVPAITTDALLTPIIFGSKVPISYRYTDRQQKNKATSA